MKKKITKIVKWLKEMNTQAKTDGFVVGLSGGIDSALVAALCEKANPGKTMAVILPCHSDDEDAKDAYLVAQAIGVQVLEVNLDNTYDTLVNELLVHSPEPTRMSLANIKPRLRMTSLYFYANTYNKLVVGTGNRDERFVGYFTKWGDGAADIMPLANLSKVEVYEMSRNLDLPTKIINKAPSAGLWANQTDEKEMGFTYQQLDDYINGVELSEDIQQRIKRMHQSSRHKLMLPPVFEGE